MICMEGCLRNLILLSAFIINLNQVCECSGLRELEELLVFWHYETWFLCFLEVLVAFRNLDLSRVCHTLNLLKHRQCFWLRKLIQKLCLIFLVSCL